MHLYTQTLLHTNIFTPKHSNTQTRLHTNTFYTQKLLHTITFKQMEFYIQSLIHTNIFTLKHSYTQTRLHTKTFTQKFYTQHFYTYALVHTNTFTQTSLHRNARTHKPLCVRESYSSTRKIAILPQFLTIDPHFVRKGCSRASKIAIFLSFADQPSFRAKGLPFRDSPPVPPSA